MFVETVKKSGKWGLIGLAVVSCCVIGSLAKPSTPTTVSKWEPTQTQTAAPELPTYTPKPELPTDVPAPTVDTCKAVVQKWSGEMVEPTSLLLDAMNQGSQGDMASYGKTLERAMRAYLEVDEPFCDADAMKAHDNTNLAFQAYANAFISWNAGNFKQAKDYTELGTEFINLATTYNKKVKDKYFK